MDNPRFIGDEDIPLIDDAEYDETLYDTPESSRIEEMSFTDQPAVRLRPTQERLEQQLLRGYIEDLCKYLDVNPGNIDFVDTSLFKVEKLKSGSNELKFFDGENWVSLTNKRNGNFLAKSTLRNKFGGIERMKRILSIEGDDLNISFAKKLQEELPTDQEMETIPLKDLGNLAETLHIATREASTNTDLDMREFLAIDRALQRVQGEIRNNLGKLSELDQQLAKD